MPVKKKQTIIREKQLQDITPTAAFSLLVISQNKTFNLKENYLP